MPSAKHFVYAWLTYLMAFSGVFGFYFDIRTGGLIKSRVLCIYRRIFCLGFFLVVSFRTIAFRQISPNFHTRSHLMTLFLTVYPYIRWITFACCMYCALRWEQRIFHMLQGLLKVEKFLAESHYCLTLSEEPYLRRLFWIRFLLHFPRSIVFIIYAIRAKDGFCIFLSAFGSKTFVDELYYLTFIIIWKICYTLMKLHRYLNQLYAGPIPSKSKNEETVLQVHGMYYKLIRISNEFCEVFKYPLACLLLLLICMTCVTGYAYCRLIFGKPSKSNQIITEWLTLLININYFLELYLLTLTTSMTRKIHESTLLDLRTSACLSDSNVVKRSREWLGLQLAVQDTDIKIFGVLNINLQMIFPLISGIILQIIYIIQCDYNYM